MTSALLIIKHHLGDNVRVSSDGNIGDWAKPLALVIKTLDYSDIWTMTQEGELKNEPEVEEVNV